MSRHSYQGERDGSLSAQEGMSVDPSSRLGVSQPIQMGQAPQAQAIVAGECA